MPLNGGNKKHDDQACDSAFPNALATDTCTATTIAALGTELTRLALISGLLAVEFASAAAQSDESLFYGLQGARKVMAILLTAMVLVASSMACAMLAIMPPTRGCQNMVLARFFVLFIIMSVVEILCLLILMGLSCDENDSTDGDIWACTRAPTILALGLPVQLPTVGGRVVVFMTAWNAMPEEHDDDDRVGKDSQHNLRAGKHTDPESLMEETSDKPGAGIGLRHRGTKKQDDMSDVDDRAPSDTSTDTGQKMHPTLEQYNKTCEEHMQAVRNCEHHIEDLRLYSNTVHKEVRRFNGLLDAQVAHRKTLERNIEHALVEHRGMAQQIHGDFSHKLNDHTSSHRQSLDEFKQQLQELSGISKSMDQFKRQLQDFSAMAQAVGISKVEAGTKRFQQNIADALALPEKQRGDTKKFALSLLNQASEMASILCAVDQTPSDPKEIRRLREKYKSAKDLRDLIAAAIETEVRDALQSSGQGRDLVKQALHHDDSSNIDIAIASDSEQPRSHNSEQPRAHPHLSPGGFRLHPHSLQSSMPPNSREGIARNLFSDYGSPQVRARSFDSHSIRRSGSHESSPFLRPQNSYFQNSPPRMMPPPPMATPSPVGASPSPYGQRMMGGGQSQMAHVPFQSPQLRS